MDDDDHQWNERVREARTGSPAAADALARALLPLVTRIARARSGPRWPVEDLVQESLLRIFRSLDQYRGDAPFPHWAARVAVRACLDRARHAGRRPLLVWSELDPRLRDVLQALDQPDPVPAARELVAELLDRLEPADRLLLTWLELEERPVREVSALTGWTAVRVRVAAFRARARAKALWKQLENPPA